ncbi:MAG: hypothetical protein M2R45_01082 [Verrucomicrobia subdivision 3 bacterium]|nr:hypothetical protein [Limisphaerales bacterium]MCS1414193.1 hypothetical protein [Limisphaerales bacterium]
MLNVSDITLTPEEINLLLWLLTGNGCISENKEKLAAARI